MVDTSKLMKRRVANNIINLTDSEIKMYEEQSGCIWKFQPDGKKVPDDFLPDWRHQEAAIYYIVDVKIVNELIRKGRSLEDIAVVKQKAVGRKNKVVSYPVWAGDMKTSVILVNNGRRPAART